MIGKKPLQKPPLNLMKQGENSSHVRARNERAAVLALYRYGQRSKSELARDLDLTVQAVTRIVNDLQEQGVIVPSSCLFYEIGRPLRRYQLNDNYLLSSGFFIEDKTIHFYLVNIHGKIIFKRQITITSYIRLKTELASFIEEIKSSNGMGDAFDEKRMLGIGFSAQPSTADVDKIYDSIKLALKSENLIHVPILQVIATLDCFYDMNYRRSSLFIFISDCLHLLTMKNGRLLQFCERNWDSIWPHNLNTSKTPPEPAETQYAIKSITQAACCLLDIEKIVIYQKLITKENEAEYKKFQSDLENFSGNPTSVILKDAYLPDLSYGCSLLGLQRFMYQ